MSCNVFKTMTQRIVKILPLEYDVAMNLVYSCYSEATQQNYVHTHQRDYESYCYIAKYIPRYIIIF